MRFSWLCSQLQFGAPGRGRRGSQVAQGFGVFVFGPEAVAPVERHRFVAGNPKDPLREAVYFFEPPERAVGF